MIERDHHINIFWSPEDACYVAGLPDFKFCSALGERPQEALAELLTAKQAWIEAARAHGHPIPEPRYRPFAEAPGASA